MKECIFQVGEIYALLLCKEVEYEEKYFMNLELIIMLKEKMKIQTFHYF